MNDYLIRVILSLENSLVRSAGKGGLGELEADIFLGRRETEDNGEKWLFFTPLYGKILKQEYVDGEIVTRVLDFGIPKTLRLVDSFGIELKNESIKIEVYEHSLSTNNTKAYFLYSDCFNHPIYEAGDIRKEIRTSCCFVRGVVEYLKRHKISPHFLHLNESEAFFLLPYLNSSPTVYFHSHTPEPHGHKRFYIEDLKSSLNEEEIERLKVAQEGEMINMGKYAATVSKGIVCVSRQHAEVTKYLYPMFEDKIISITNGIHRRWIGEEWERLFDEEISGWRKDARLLERVKEISDKKMVETKEEEMENFESYIIKKIESKEAVGNFDSKKLSFVYAKRLTEYKRPLHAFSLLDLEINLVLSGPPVDEIGRRTLEEIKRLSKMGYPVVYVLNYNSEVAKNLLKAYAWLNLAYFAREASGTSYEKALMNGTLLITTSCGSVPEFIKDEYNGFLVKDDLSDLRDKAKRAIEVYNDKNEWAKMIKNCFSTYSVLIDRVIEEFKKLR